MKSKGLTADSFGNPCILHYHCSSAHEGLVSDNTFYIYLSPPVSRRVHKEMMKIINIDCSRTKIKRHTKIIGTGLGVLCGYCVSLIAKIHSSRAQAEGCQDNHNTTIMR